VVPGRVLVLLAIHPLYARLFRVHPRPAAAQEHANDPSNGQQALQDPRVPDA